MEDPVKHPILFIPEQDWDKDPVKEFDKRQNLLNKHKNAISPVHWFSSHTGK
jgi:hypothetical protein